VVVLGILILVLVAVLIIAAAVRGEDAASLDLEWFTVETTVAGVFLAGALTLLIGVVGVVLVAAGLKRGRRRRAEMHSLRDQAAAKDQEARRARAAEAEARESTPPAGSRHATPASDPNAPRTSDPDAPQTSDAHDEHRDSAPRDKR